MKVKKRKSQKSYKLFLKNNKYRMIYLARPYVFNINHVKAETFMKISEEIFKSEFDKLFPICNKKFNTKDEGKK